MSLRAHVRSHTLAVLVAVIFWAALAGCGLDSHFGRDIHGSVRYLTDRNGIITDTFDFDAFGNLVSRTGSTPNNYLYQGEQYDSDLKLYYLRARYADPDRGRFWTMDSFEGFGTDPKSLHKYTFCHNDPVNYRDPNGHFEGGLAGSNFTVALAQITRAALLSLQQSMTTCRLQSAATAGVVGGLIGGLASEGITAIVGAFTGNAPTTEELMKAFSDGFADGSMAGLAAGLSPFTAAVYFGYAAAMAGMDFWRDWNNPNVPTWVKYMEGATLVASLMPLMPSVAKKLNQMLQMFCFPAGTEVAADHGQKPIEQVRAGDLIWAQSDQTGEVMLKRVKRVFVSVAASLVVLHCGTNTLEATPEHPLWVADQGWKAAGQVQSGDGLWTRLGEPFAVTGISLKQGQFTVYNLEVEEFHSYFVGKEAVLAHNSCEDILERTWRRIHDKYVQRIRPGAKEVTVATPWSSSSGLGARKYDDFDFSTMTGYEGNTTPWKDMSIEKMQHKLDQVGSDYALLKSGAVKKVIWFGTEPLPTSGYGGRLRQALQEAGIEYLVKP